MQVAAYRKEEPEEPVDEIGTLIEQLSSRDTRQHRHAVLALFRAGAPAVTPLLSLLATESNRRRRKRPLRIGLTLTAAGMYLWWLANLASPMSWNLLLILIPLLLGLLSLHTATRVQVDAAQVLAMLDDMRAVGPLAEALEYQEWQLPRARSAAAEALIRLLPRLQPKDAGLLDAHQRACLYRALVLPSPESPRLPIAILHALACIGDAAALPAMERLTRHTPLTQPQKQIQEEAQQAARLLRARLEGEQAPHILLRSSEATTAPDMLLRPATEASVTDPRQLLRATHDSTDSGT